MKEDNEKITNFTSTKFYALV